MAADQLRRERPARAEDAAAVLREAAAHGAVARIRGNGTKPWGAPGEPAELELSTLGLDRILEHNEGDLTAVLEAGVTLTAAQERFARAGQTLMLDPPLGPADGATIGGIVSAGDSGPCRHRYGGPRDLVLGTRVALSDGTLARSGGKVIKNVAGYDLAKLLTGAFGTLGLVCEIAVRLHPLPKATATVRARSDDPGVLADVASALAHARIETDALDVRWSGADGAVLGRYAGAAAGELAQSARALVRGADAEIVEDDASAWADQRAGQRAAEGAVVRVSGRLSELRRVIEATQAAGGALVGRAALGLSWIALPPGTDGDLIAAIDGVRRALGPRPCVVLDAPAGVRAAVDPWQSPGGAELELMRRVKARFDPAHACNRGLFVGGI
jgi:glycolate oxidase FAD binding subunit